MPRATRRTAILVATLALAGACSSGSSNEASGDPELDRGRDVYSTNCARCHGPDGGGGVGPKLNDGLMETRFPDIEDQIAVITNGMGAMPAWEGTLDPDEIQAVARYTREGF
jgi:mono/diheme cytochrome c family protein